MKMTEILNNNEISKLKWFNSPRQRRQKLDRLLASVLKMHRSNKIYKIRIHRDCFNFYSVVTLLLRMYVKWGVHWGNRFGLQM
jgi:hypothetical protein